MKKLILAFVVIAAVGISSCKKEDSVQLEANNVVKLEKKDTTQWD